MDVSALALASRELLKSGDAVGAERVLAPVFRQLGADASVLHLMGLIKKAQNKMEEAERHLRSAVAYSLNDGAYYNDLGVVLQARGAYPEAIKVFRAALALMPYAAQVRVNLARCLQSAGDYAEAETEAEAYVKAEPSAEAWTLLSQIQRAQDRNQEALVSAANALKLGPTVRGLRLNHGIALARVGRTREALDAFHALALEKIDTPELALNLARALYTEGRKAEAEQTLADAAVHYPDVLALHTNLARMRQLRGEGEGATALMEQEIARRPQDLGLRLSCADILHRGKHHQKALRILEQALAVAPESPQLLTAYGIVLDELDRPDEGLIALRRVAQLMPRERSAKRNLLSTLLRARQPDEALSIVRTLRADDPHEQYLIACEAMALRMLGDSGYRKIYDYERFVRSYEIPAPRGFFTPENFHASLADVLRLQHQVNAHPLDQSIVNGTQTGRSLLTLDEPNLRVFLGAVDAAVRDYCSRLEIGDPVGRRLSDRSRFANLWSVRIKDKGYMANHVHDRGWISSAYYVAFTPSEKQRDARAGWLKLGEPNRPPPGCDAEAFVEPKEGRLVLFPSYMWHGTIPFEGDERLSLSFDVTPS
ncbi:MAG: tetratricopeptide repeat protein [Proteobacteria bacterium]|nr:tetratricopeptide repeat protein [Pseudomonadota bacterium]